MAHADCTPERCPTLFAEAAVGAALARLEKTATAVWRLFDGCSAKELRTDSSMLADLIRVTRARSSLLHKNYAAGTGDEPESMNLALGVSQFTHRIQRIRGKVAAMARDKNCCSVEPAVAHDLVQLSSLLDGPRFIAQAVAGLAALNEPQRGARPPNQLVSHQAPCGSPSFSMMWGYAHLPEVRVVGPNGYIDLALHGWTRPENGWVSLAGPGASQLFVGKRGPFPSDWDRDAHPLVASVAYGQFDVFIYPQRRCDGSSPMGHFVFPVGVIAEYLQWLDDAWPDRSA